MTDSGRETLELTREHAIRASALLRKRERDEFFAGTALGLNIAEAVVGGILVADGKPVSGALLILSSLIVINDMNNHGALKYFISRKKRK